MALRPILTDGLPLSWNTITLRKPQIFFKKASKTMDRIGILT
jgi:hypothetical protein